MLQKTTKNLTLSKELLVQCAKELLDFKNKYELFFTSYLEEFCKEALEVEATQKNYTPERCAKVLASIEIYYTNNPIVQSDSISGLTGSLEGILQKNEVFAIYLKYTKDIYTLLHTKLRKMDYMSASLYFADTETRDKISMMFESMDKLLTNQTLQKRFSLSKVVNFYNIDSPCHKYSVKYVPKYQYIKKPESVERYLPAHYEIWVNKEKKYFNDYLKTHNLDPNTVSKLTLEHEQKLKRAKEEYEYIEQNPDSLDVRILGYEDADVYPQITITLEKGSKDRHLKSETPNLLWFIPKPFRSTMDAKEFIETSQYAGFGDVYYKVK